MTGQSSLSRNTAVAVCGAIAIATAILVGHSLGASDICSGNEAVEAVFVQQMVERGRLLFPLENGKQPMYKPPLFHWTATALDRLAGLDRVTARNLRATSALYAVAGAIATMVAAGALLGGEGAILAGLTLAGSYQFISQGRFGRVDMALCFYEAVTLFAFLWWMPRAGAIAAEALNHRSRLYALAIAMGLAVLAKGPVGAIVPGIAILIFMIAERRFSQLPALLEPGPLIVGGLIASSWYVACYLGGRFGFLNRQLGSENFGRFFGTLGAMAPWYYLKPVLLNSAPLSLLIPFAVIQALRMRRTSYISSDDEPASGAVRLFAIFWITTIVFFTIAAYKRRSYLLPLWPPSAIMLAWWIMSASHFNWGRFAKWAFATTCCGLIVFNFIYIPRKEVRDCADTTYRPAAEEILRAVGTNEPLYTYGFDEELAPLLFYLNRDAPIIRGKLDDAPPGYVIVPRKVWRSNENLAPGFTPILTSDHGKRKLILLRRGGSTYADR